ncbi:toll/interleukin-1 receptor domain-containing protein [Shewanella ulleungensis]|nr:toll/interleukin-1 receptor domain-containing protein [Shewanella ulleungensis]MCL1148882.1 toll/interleukin-1 receptor domain-containing protein [Shewanella ulleungensis]
MPKVSKTNNQPSHYWAFISYSHKDKKWADWIHRALETYKIPKAYVGTQTAVGEIPNRLFPVFRDREELPTSSDLSSNINSALDSSKCLIVICSPNSAKSHWVNEEILEFKRRGKSNRILSIIIEGEPNTGLVDGVNAECFPQALRFIMESDGQLTDKSAEPIAADLRKNKDGLINAKLKLIAGIIGLPFDALRQRDQRRRQKQLAIIGLAVAVGLSVFTWLTAQWLFQRHEKLESQSQSLTRSSYYNLINNNIALGTAQLHAATNGKFASFTPQNPLDYFWLNRLRPLEEILTGLPQQSIVYWQNKAYFHSHEEKLLALPNQDIISWTITPKSQYLFVITESSATEWLVSSYTTDTLQPIGNYSIEKLERTDAVLTTVPKSDLALLQTTNDTSYLGGTMALLIALQTNSHSELVATRAGYINTYISNDCDSLLLESEQGTLTQLNLQRLDSKTNYLYFNDPNYKKDWQTSFNQQLSQQGFIFTKEKDLETGEPYIIKLNQNHSVQGTWDFAGNLLEYVKYLCPLTSRGESNYVSLADEIETDGNKKPAQSFRLEFPSVISEVDMWLSTLKPLTNPAPVELLEKLSEGFDSGTDSQETLDGMLSQLWEAAKQNQWEVNSWPEIDEYQTTRRLLLRAFLNQGGIPDVHANTLMSAVDFEFVQKDQRLYVLASYHAGNTDFRGKLVCSVNLQGIPKSQCFDTTIPQADFISSKPSLNKNILLYSSLKMMGSQSFEVLDLKFNSLVTPEQTPSGTVNTENIAINNAQTRLTAITEDSVWSYSRSNSGDFFKLEKVIPLVSKLDDIQAENWEENSQDSAIGGKKAIITEDAQIILADSLGSFQKIDLNTGISQWQIMLNTDSPITNQLHFFTDETQHFLVAYWQQGLQMFDLKSGLPLSSPVTFSALDGFTENNTDASVNNDTKMISIVMSTTGEVQFVKGDKLWIRPTPKLNRSSDIIHLTGRMGDYAEQGLTELPTTSADKADK